MLFAANISAILNSVWFNIFIFGAFALFLYFVGVWLSLFVAIFISTVIYYYLIVGKKPPKDTFNNIWNRLIHISLIVSFLLTILTIVIPQMQFRYNVLKDKYETIYCAGRMLIKPDSVTLECGNKIFDTVGLSAQTARSYIALLQKKDSGLKNLKIRRFDKGGQSYIELIGMFRVTYYPKIGFWFKQPVVRTVRIVDSQNAQKHPSVPPSLLSDWWIKDYQTRQEIYTQGVKSFEFRSNFVLRGFVIVFGSMILLAMLIKLRQKNLKGAFWLLTKMGSLLLIFFVIATLIYKVSFPKDNKNVRFNEVLCTNFKAVPSASRHYTLCTGMEIYCNNGEKSYCIEAGKLLQMCREYCNLIETEDVRLLVDGHKEYIVVDIKALDSQK